MFTVEEDWVKWCVLLLHETVLPQRAYAQPWALVNPMVELRQFFHSKQWFPRSWWLPCDFWLVLRLAIQSCGLCMRPLTDPFRSSHSAQPDFRCKLTVAHLLMHTPLIASPGIPCWYHQQKVRHSETPFPFSLHAEIQLMWHVGAKVLQSRAVSGGQFHMQPYSPSFPALPFPQPLLWRVVPPSKIASHSRRLCLLRSPDQESVHV